MRVITKAMRAAALATFLWGIASAVQAQSPKIQPATIRPPVPGGINQTPFFSNPQVRQQIGINNTQYGGLSQAYQNAWANHQKRLNNIDKNLPAAQYQQRAHELQPEFHREFSATHDKFLPDPGQRQRYEQLYRQYQVYGAFNDPTVAEKLKLTPAQRDQLNKYQQEWTGQMNQLGSMYPTNRDKVAGQFTQIQGQNPNRINSVLTTQQQAAWGRMIGNPFAFAPEVYFGSDVKSLGGGKK